MNFQARNQSIVPEIESASRRTGEASAPKGTRRPAAGSTSSPEPEASPSTVSMVRSRVRRAASAPRPGIDTVPETPVTAPSTARVTCRFEPCGDPEVA